MTRVGVACAFVSIILVSTGIVVFAESTEVCPTFCVCDTWYGLQRASCTSRHLYSIHTGAPYTTKALDLSNNSISSLGNFELANAGLRGLKYLNLSGNSISEIDLNAFGGLEDLTILDLSRNHLYYVLSDVFIDNPNLRIVKLSKNNFNSHVPKFRSPYLKTLTMASCRISHIPLDTFKDLNHLLNLDLSNNLMIQLDVAVFRPLVFLKMLSLDGNPWSCNPLMFHLQLYLRHRNIEFSTVCDKAPAPKKFEKMIIAPSSKSSNNHHAVTPKTIKHVLLSTKKPMNALEKGNVSMCSLNEREKNRVSAIDDLSPYWFLLSGFVLGSAITLVLSYAWLNKPSGCSPRCILRGSVRNDPQRLSLLSSLWQYEDLTRTENVNSTISRSGTPPPPYREVMLRPTLYPSPAI